MLSVFLLPLTAAGKGLANLSKYSSSAFFMSWPRKMIFTAPCKENEVQATCIVRQSMKIVCTNKMIVVVILPCEIEYLIESCYLIQNRRHNIPLVKPNNYPPHKSVTKMIQNLLSVTNQAAIKSGITSSSLSLPSLSFSLSLLSLSLSLKTYLSSHNRYFSRRPSIVQIAPHVL